MLTPKVEKLYKSLIVKYDKIDKLLPASFNQEEEQMNAMLEQQGLRTAVSKIRYLYNEMHPERKTPIALSHYEQARLRTYKEIKDRASSQSMHEIMLVLYDTPEYKALGTTVWQMHYHIGQAIIAYVVQNEKDVISFLKGESHEQ